MKFNYRKSVVLAFLVAFMLGVTACNTVEGIGKDTKKAGKEIQEEANEHK